MQINLITLRASNVPELGQFYQALGLSFMTEKHGNGPEHLACDMGNLTFEIYPCASPSSTAGMRLGFCVDELAASFANALHHGAECVSPPRQTSWGRYAVVKDPAGHLVELTQPTTAQTEVYDNEL